jgi:SAM-dependent methyltransferase
MRNAAASARKRRTTAPSPVPPEESSSAIVTETQVLVPPQRQFPPEFDPEHYRTIHADLRSLTDEELRAHYASRGKAEGRQPNILGSREMFRDLALGLGSILEIGPFTRPLFRRPDVPVIYFDVLDRAGLAELAAKIGAQDTDQIPEVDFVSPTADLSVVCGVFDVVANSHSIEHQPDLVRHLHSVERLLHPGGCYFLWIPDKRYCLDYFQAESTIADVLEAADEQRRFHTLGTLIAQEVRRAHNDPRRHWLGDHGSLPEHPAHIIRAVLGLYQESRERDEYVDRHAWQFTPDSFRTILELLNQLELVRLLPIRVYDTQFLSNEFWAILQNPAS